MADRVRQIQVFSFVGLMLAAGASSSMESAAYRQLLFAPVVSAGATSTPDVPNRGGVSGSLGAGASLGSSFSSVSGAEATVAQLQRLQTIIFRDEPVLVVGATASLLASGGASGNPIVFSSQTVAVCTVSGTSVRGETAGVCTIAANQAGNAQNFPAPQASLSFPVGAGPQAALVLSVLPSPTSFAATSVLSTTGGSGTGQVSYRITVGDEVCSIEGTTLRAVGVGECTVVATKAGDANYLPATASADVRVERAQQAPLALTATPSALTVGGTSSLAAVGGSGVGAVSYGLTAGGGICLLDGATVIGLAAGTCTIVATKAPDATFNAASSSLTLTVSRAQQAPLSLNAQPSAIPLTTTTLLAASGGSGSGAVTFQISAGAGNCSIDGNSLTGVGVGSCTVTALKDGDAQFAPATAQTSVQVQAATDLRISKDDSSPYALPNGTVFYEILVANAGPLAVDGARVRDSLPVGLADALWTCTPLQFASCPEVAGAGGIDQLVNLPVNGVVRYLLSARVTAPVGSTVTNSATVEAPADLIELRPVDNTASDSNLVTAAGIFGNGFETVSGPVALPP